jgi:hypothetical protein
MRDEDVFLIVLRTIIIKQKCVAERKVVKLKYSCLCIGFVNTVSVDFEKIVHPYMVVKHNLNASVSHTGFTPTTLGSKIVNVVLVLFWDAFLLRTTNTLI